MTVKITTTSSIIIALIVSLVCNVTLSSFILPNVPHSYTALAIPNQLLINNTLNNNQSDKNNITSLTHSVKPVNHPPVAKVGPDQTVNESSKVMLVGFAFDPDSNDKLTYSWMQTAGPAVILNDANTSLPTFTAPSNISVNTDLIFRLTVKDSKNGTGAADVKVTVKYVPPPNQLPTANAGSDQTVNAGYIVSLDGSKSKDPDNDPLTYTWKQVDEPAVTLDGTNTATPSFTAPTASSNNRLKFSLTVKDDKDAESTNPAIVSVTMKADVSGLTDKVNALNYQGNYTQALQYVDKALAIDPNNKDALNNKGNALNNQGKYAEAITYYDKALAIDPNFKVALDNKQIALSKMGR